MNARELVQRTLNFEAPARVPRQLWALPWAEYTYPKELAEVRAEFKDDILSAPDFLTTPLRTKGEPFEVGTYIDEWNCCFENKQRGIQGEVKSALIQEDEWEDKGNLCIPRELLTVDKEKVNEFCRKTDKYVLMGPTPNIFERLQYIRGTEQLFVDLMLRPEGMFDVIRQIHSFYCELLTLWAQTDVDALKIMDDWGTQISLLINPQLWVEIFKPLYKEYVAIAHRHGKKIFMHSDGYILDILPHLVEIGVDAINCQVFCMGTENLSQFKGKITFWGEIDRQYILPSGTAEEVESAVHSLKDAFWQNGGCIAQCEFGPGAKPENVKKVFETWAQLV